MKNEWICLKDHPLPKSGEKWPKECPYPPSFLDVFVKTKGRKNLIAFLDQNYWMNSEKSDSNEEYYHCKIRATVIAWREIPDNTIKQQIKDAKEYNAKEREKYYENTKT